MQNNYMNLGEVCKLLGISRQAMHRLQKNGRIVPDIKARTLSLFAKDKVEAFRQTYVKRQKVVFRKNASV